VDPGFKRLVEDAADVVEEEIGPSPGWWTSSRQFARLPEVQPEPLELNAFLEEFLVAYNRFEPDAEVVVELAERAGSALHRSGADAAGAPTWSPTPSRPPGRAGKAKVWIRVPRPRHPDGVELRVEPTTAPGVPLDQAEKIFEPYFTTKAEGTGLGLAIVKKIVLQHRGSISLRRAPGGGAAFVILLPPAPKGAVPERSEAEEEAKEIARRSQTRLPAITEE
jgi:two-component system nitrogen regulation sensor histidine kinase NtrY